MTAKAKKSEGVEIFKVEKQTVRVHLIGSTPIILNRMSEKAARQLLLPPKKLTKSIMSTRLKHNPFEEFRASPYTDNNPKGPTFITHLASAFKASMRGAAVDLPGASKAQIGRLLRVETERIAIYGVPKLFMAIVRSADMNRTPDVRTRTIIQEWACTIDITYCKPLINETSVANLLTFAGMTQGVGDWRSEKGSGDYGSYEIVKPTNAKFKSILKTGGRKVQLAAMKAAEPYDLESEDLLSWFNTEARARGFFEDLADSSITATDAAPAPTN